MSKKKKKRSYKANTKNINTKKTAVNKKVIIIAAAVIAAIIAGIVLFKTFYKTPEQIENAKYELTGSLVSGTSNNTLDKYHYRVNKDDTVTYAPRVNEKSENDNFEFVTVPIKTAKFYHPDRARYSRAMEMNYFEADGKRVYMQNEQINRSYIITPVPGSDEAIVFISNLNNYFVLKDGDENLVPILNEDYNGLSYSELNKKASSIENQKLYWVLNFKISDDGKYILFHTNRRQVSENKSRGIDFVSYNLKTKKYTTISKDTGDYLSYKDDVVYYADIDLAADTATYTKYDMKTQKHTKLKKMSYDTYVNNQTVENYYVSYDGLNKQIELYNIETDEKIISYNAPNIETLLNAYMSPDKKSMMVLYNKTKVNPQDPSERTTKEAVYIDLEAKFATILQAPSADAKAVTSNIDFNGNLQVMYRQFREKGGNATAYFRMIRDNKENDE